jgi:hypothetical protein
MTGDSADGKKVVTDSMLRLKQILDKNALIKQSEQKINLRRDALTPNEIWAKNALITLNNLNPDMARVVNGVGFNKLDTVMGKSLANQLNQGLTDKQWATAVAMCKKYQRQVGAPPNNISNAVA